jgi:MFS family permease
VSRPGPARQFSYAGNMPWLLRYRGAFASNIYAIFWPVYLTRDLRISVPDALGIISLAIMLSLVLEVPTGWLADRYGRRAALLAGMILSMLGVGMYAAVTHLGPALFVAVVIDHLGGGLASGPDTALATDTSYAIGKDLWGDVFRRYAEKRVSYNAIGRGVGGLAGAGVAIGFGLRATLWAQVAAYGLAFLCAWRVKTPPRHGDRIPHLGRTALGLLGRVQRGDRRTAHLQLLVPVAVLCAGADRRHSAARGVVRGDLVGIHDLAVAIQSLLPCPVPPAL